MKWEDLTAERRSIHDRVNLSPHCYGGILSHSDDRDGFFLTLRLEANTSIDGTLAECKRDFLSLLIPILEANLAEVKRLAEEEP